MLLYLAFGKCDAGVSGVVVTAVTADITVVDIAATVSIAKFVYL